MRTLAKTRILKGISIIAALAGVFAAAIQCHAQRFLADKIRKMYELDRRNGDCRMCHAVREHYVYPHKLNVFGVAIRVDPRMQSLLNKDNDEQPTPEELDVLVAVLKKLEYVDSDDDGAYNIEEFELGTFPGNPDSVPDSTDLKKFRERHPLPNYLLPPETAPPVLSTLPPIAKRGYDFPLEWLVAGGIFAAFSIIGWAKWRGGKTVR